MSEINDGIIDAEESCDQSAEDMTLLHAELCRLSARRQEAQAKRIERTVEMRLLKNAHKVLVSAMRMGNSLDYSALVKAAEYEEIELEPVLRVLDEDLVDIPDWATCDTIASSF